MFACRWHAQTAGLRRTKPETGLSFWQGPSTPWNWVVLQPRINQLKANFLSVFTSRWLVIVSLSTFSVFRCIVGVTVNRLSFKITLHVTGLQHRFPISDISKTKNSKEENRWSHCSGLMSSSNPTPTSTGTILAWLVLVGVDVCGYLLSHFFIS